MDYENPLQLGKSGEKIEDNDARERRAQAIRELKDAELTRPIAIDLSGRELTDLPDDSFAKLDCVTQLFLYGNYFSVLPSSIATMRELRALMVQENHLVSFPSELAMLDKLEILDFRHNKIGSESMSCVYRLRNLKQVLASYNKIKAIDDEIANLNQLEYLILHRNGPKISISDQIGCLTKLRRVDFSHCTLENGLPDCKSLVPVSNENSLQPYVTVSRCRC
ncbi:hypothetical protein Ciccas_004504 [Cichlidogyrus casuarinus]|uniref:Uncharacterized protein n=1 Tax=Cichlidogyrus casuarinus TaxID=1844966 RepID=A0ABD2QBA8_9PLAT